MVSGIDESGGEARVYALDDTLMLKTQRPQRLRPRTSLEKEVWFLRRLADEGIAAAPRVLGYGHEEGVEYICMTRVPGVALRQARIDDADRAETLRYLGRMLRRIHQLPTAPFVGSALFPADRSASDLIARIEAGFAQAVEAIHAFDRAWSVELSPEEAAAAAVRAVPAAEERVALHSNPGPEHVFVDAASGRFSGLIDFGDAYISHPALDLRPWRLARDRSAVLEGYQAEGEVSDSFLAVWRVARLLGEMMAIARGRQDPATTEATLREVLAEL
jgi:aminoglycoside phosphotransferase